MGYLSKIKALNNATTKGMIPFMIDDVRVGQIKDKWLDIFLDSSIFIKNVDFLTLKADNFENRNKDLETLAHLLYQKDMTNRRLGELYALRENYHDKPMALCDRTLSTYLGINTYGVHVNGYFIEDGSIKMWIARRAKNKGFDGGKLDQIAAGGLPYDISPKDNVIKESMEEASIPLELSKKALLTGYVSYHFSYDKGTTKDTIFCYDLELPKDFKPKINDDEVEEFYLMDIEEVAQIVKNSDDFKKNCNLVIIDFLIRHGVIDEKERDYFEIVSNLRR